MPVVHFRFGAFRELYDADVDQESFLERVPMIGSDIDAVYGDDLHIEFFPDRPDLVSVEGVARAMRAFDGLETGLKRYAFEAEPGAADRLDVDASVADVRPFIVMCRVEGLGPLGDEGLKTLMDFQEKLGHGIGRRRRRVAIGIHDAADLEGPYRYTTVDADYRFHPLQSDGDMSVREVLVDHPKGRAYAHLLPESGPFPVILDAHDRLLSLPPVINGIHTELREDTTDVVLDLTGPDPETLRVAMAILVTAMADRGARVIPFHVSYPKDTAFGSVAAETLTTPDLTPHVGALRVAEAERVLGFGLDRAGVVDCLARMGHDASADPNDEDLVRVSSPAWRADLLHEWDLIEDVAKGYGYASVEDDQPKVTTFGRVHPDVKRARTVRTSLTGLGLMEATTLTITSPRAQYARWNLETPGGDDAPARVANPVTEEHTMMRTWVLPSLFEVLAANLHRDYPQGLFEVGQVVDPHTGHGNAWRVAGVRADPKAGFSQVKGLVQRLLTDLDVTARLDEDDHPGFIAGRAARFVADDGSELGRFGEVHPAVLDRYELRVPAVAFEFDLDRLFHR